MSDLDFNLGKLAEELTLNREVISPPLRPPYYSFMDFLHRYGHRASREYDQTPGEILERAWRHGKPDIKYTNADGKVHRLFGPAFISKEFNIRLWYKDSFLHRENGPAITHNNTFMWFYEGLIHRLGGPAIYGDGIKKRYYIHGQPMPPKEYKREIARRRRRGLIK